MKDQTDPSLLHPSAAADLQRRRLLQAMGAMSVVGLPGIAMAQQFPTAKVNTTKLAVTDTEVVVGQLHSSSGTMAISETGSIQAEQLAIDQIKATLNKPSKISAQTWMTQFFGLLCLSRGPFGQFAGR